MLRVYSNSSLLILCGFLSQMIISAYLILSYLYPVHNGYIILYYTIRYDTILYKLCSYANLMTSIPHTQP